MIIQSTKLDLLDFFKCQFYSNDINYGHLQLMFDKKKTKWMILWTIYNFYKPFICRFIILKSFSEIVC